MQYVILYFHWKICMHLHLTVVVSYFDSACAKEAHHGHNIHILIMPWPWLLLPPVYFNWRRSMPTIRCICPPTASIFSDRREYKVIVNIDRVKQIFRSPWVYWKGYDWRTWGTNRCWLSIIYMKHWSCKEHELDNLCYSLLWS
jgi:hypothetical protein